MNYFVYTALVTRKTASTDTRICFWKVFPKTFTAVGQSCIYVNAEHWSFHMWWGMSAAVLQKAHVLVWVCCCLLQKSHFTCKSLPFLPHLLVIWLCWGGCSQDVHSVKGFDGVLGYFLNLLVRFVCPNGKIFFKAYFVCNQAPFSARLWMVLHTLGKQTEFLPHYFLCC